MPKAGEVYSPTEVADSYRSSDYGEGSSTSDDDTATLNALGGDANEPRAPNRGTLGLVRQEGGQSIC